jgi:hypothetical protein
MKYFKIVDLPKSSIAFQFKGRDNVRTILGGILNIILLIIALVVFNIFSSDMINKINPNIFIQNIIDEDNKTIKMNKSTINVIIQPYYSKGIEIVYEVDYTLFTIIGANASYNLYENGTRKQYFEYFPIKPCEEKDFDKSQLDFFRKNRFDKTAFCMGTKDLEVKGQFTSSIFKFLNFRIDECNGFNLRTGEKVICQSKAERDAKIGKFKTSVYFTYTMPNVLDYEKPFTSQVFNTAYTFNPTSLSKDNFFFSGDVLYTDDNLFISTENFDNESGKLDITNFSSLQASISNMSAFSKDVYLSFYYRVSPSYINMKRTYKKIPDVFAQILPLIEIAIFFNEIFISPFRSHALIMEIINEAFIHTTEERREAVNKLKKENKNSSSNLNLRPINSEGGTLGYFHKRGFNNFKNDPQNIKKFNLIIDTYKTNISSKSNIFKKERISKMINHTGFKYLPSRGIFRYCCNKKEKFIFSQFKEKINMLLEINSYLNIKNDLDKLQTLLLTDNQKNVLPLWNFDYFINSEGKVNTQWLSNNDEITKKSIRAYYNINNHTEKSNIETKLLKEINFVENEID